MLCVVSSRLYYFYINKYILCKLNYSTKIFLIKRKKVQMSNQVTEKSDYIAVHFKY